MTYQLFRDTRAWLSTLDPAAIQFRESLTYLQISSPAGTSYLRFFQSGAALRADTHAELRVATREARTRLTAALGKEDTAGHHIATSAQGAALRAHLQRVAQAQQEQAPAS